MDELIKTIAVYALPVIFAITLHEAAHAYAAKFFGDTTAYSQGRMSLNPLVHIDPFGTILVPVLMYFASGGAFLFGYAKPVPVNFGQLRHPKRDMAWVSLAGPAANFLLALLWMIFALLLADFSVSESFFYQMAKAGILTNLVMFAFNLFPVPPLDGGRIVVSLLPHKLAYKFAQIEPYGFFIVMGLMVLQVMKFWLIPIIVVAQVVLDVFITPFKLILG